MRGQRLAWFLIAFMCVALEAGAESTVRIVMLGDSLIARGNWTKLLGRDDVANHGLDGDTIRGATRRAARIGSAGSGPVIVMVGINDLIRNRPVGACAHDMRRLILQLRKQAPGARLVISSVLPVGPSLQRLSPQIEELRRRYRELCGDGACTYLDVAADFREHHLHSDDLHLSAAGYAHWASVLQREILEAPTRVD